MSDGSVTIDTKLTTKEFEKGLGKIEGIAKKGLGIVTTASGIAIGTLTALGGYAIKVGSSFEAGMSKVQAISGATNEELTALTEKAKEMGAKTKFSATESAEAFQYMAMAGWKTGDMLNGIEGIMNLAAASGEDLASVSDIVTDALTAFGLQASDSAHFADVLAKASSNSNTNVGLMGETFKYVAPLAGSMGYSIEDTAVAIGLMANAGIKGSQAGTALRSTMTRLVKPPKEAAEAMKRLGISVKNNDGTMKPLSQTLGDLRKKFSKLSESQKASYAASIAGQEAMSGLLAIVNASESDYQKLVNSINNADGAAKEMADTMNNNLAGATTIMKSNMETLGLAIYDKFKEPATRAVNAVTDVLSRLTDSVTNGELSGSFDKLGESFGEFVTKMADGVEKYLPKIIEIMSWIIANAPTIIGLLAKITIGLKALEIGSKVIDGINKLRDFNKMLSETGIKANIASKATKLLSNSLKSIKTAAAAVAKVITTFGATIGGVVAIVAGVATAVTSFLSMMKNGFSWVKEAIMLVGIAITAVGAVILGVPAAIAGVIAAVVAVLATIVVVVKEHWTEIKNFFSNVGTAIASFFTETIPAAWETFKTKLRELGNSIVTTLQNAWNTVVTFFTEGIPNFINSVIDWISELPYKIGYQIGLILGHIVQFGLDAWNWVTTELPLIIEGIVTWFSELPGKIWTWLSDVISKIIEWGQQSWENAKNWTINLIDTVTQFFSELPSKLWTFLTDIINKIITWGQQSWQNAKTYTRNLIDSVTQFFSELPSKIWEHLTNIIEKVITWGTDMVNRGKEAARDLVEIVHTTISELPGKVMDIGRNIVEGLWNGICGAGDWIKGKVGEFASGVLQGMKDALGIHSPSRVFRDEVGKYIALGVGEGFTDNIDGVYKRMKAAVNFETQKMSASISATANLKASKDRVRTVNNDNGTTINNTQNFYDKQASPYEQQKQSKQQLRRLAYEL